MPGARVNAVNSGLIATRLNDHIAEGHSVEIGAEAIVRAALLEPDGVIGRFLEADGDLPDACRYAATSAIAADESGNPATSFGRCPERDGHANWI